MLKWLLEVICCNLVYVTVRNLWEFFLNFNFSSLGHEYELLLRQKLDEAGLAYLGSDVFWRIFCHL